ncbi:MAG: NAD-dependent epimerase/dehydratase family protein [Myxococcota bacterium]
MRCLVTGATGFIGGEILRGLQDAGHEVVAYVRETADSRALKDVARVVGDLADPNRLAEAASDCEAVVHAAGIADTGTDRETLGWAHVAGTENAVNGAKKAGCRRFVHISCADVTLHRGPRSFWNEDEAPTEPMGEHAKSKLQAEELVRVSGTRGFRTITLRPALVWGPGDATHLPRWQAEAANGGLRLIDGGKKLLATTYTGNLVHAVTLALVADVPTGSVYYIADTELSVCRDFFVELCGSLGWRRPTSGGPYVWAMLLSRLSLSPLHPTEVVRRARTSAFDTTKAKQELGYEAPIAREQGMRDLRAWLAERGAP